MSVMGQRLGKQLCEALGLNPNDILHISVHCSIGKPAQVDITFNVKGDQEDLITRLFKSYTLEEAS